jgi:Ca2+-binding EF-hand superfamily protein
MLTRFGEKVNATGVKEWISKHDFNKDNKVTFEEMEKETRLEAETPRIKAIYQKLKQSSSGQFDASNPTDMADYREIFNYADSDHMGSLDEGKIMKMHTRIGEKIDAAGAKDWISKHDFNKDNKVTFDELEKEVRIEAETPQIKALYQKMKNPPSSPMNPNSNQMSEYRKVFDYADSNHDGSLDEGKVKKMLTRIGE